MENAPMGSLKTVKSARILLLGQNSVATEQLQRFLVSESATTEIITAMDFPQGIEILAQEKLDAVLLAPSDHLKDHIESIKNIVILAENAAVVVFTDHYDPHLAPVLALHGVEQYLSMDLVNETSLWPLVLFAIHRKKSTSPKAAMHKHCQVKDFPNLLYISGFGYFEVNLKGNLICFNDFFPHYLKYSENELLGLNYRQFTDLNSAEKLCNIFNQIYITGKPEHSIEFVAVDKKGNRYHLACSCSLIKGHDGKTIGFLGITQEITQKKKAEAALKESEERYRSILEGIEYGYFELDLKGEFTFFNDAMCKISGFTRDKLTGLDSRQYMDEKNVRKLQKIYKEIYTTGKPANNIAYSRQREDGKIIHIESSASLKYDEHNKVVGFRGIAKDVTDRKKTEEKLRQSERRYRNILDSIEDAYYEIDLKGRLTFFNDAMSNLHGYSPDELKLMPHTKYTLEEDRPRLNKIHAHVYKTGKSIKNFQLKTISKNGEIRYLESSISLIKDENGVPIGYRGITRDVTDRKNTELELQKAKEDAEMATRAKSEFLANMSHEIRTPMNGIIGMYNLLLSTNLNIEQLDYVQTGKRSADGLLVIINDILDFSKIEAGKLELDIMDFDLRKAVQESIELPAMQAHQKGLEFIYQIDADIPSDLKGDPGRLKQIITNLCNNALKFTQSGEIVVRATPANETENHVRIRFTVEDTGIGINKENQKKLFRTFHQVDSSTTRKYGGTGLGLAICKKLAELMQGSIGVISDSGAGTTFWFEIPFEKQPHAEKHPPAIAQQYP